MTLAPLFSASFAVQLHAISASMALLLGPIIFYRRKGTSGHKFLGRLWVGIMSVAVASSWFIFEIGGLGPFSFIHIFSIMGTFALVQIVWYARRGQIRAHKSAVRGLYFGGLIVAGTLSFMPGRIMNVVIFGPNGDIGFNILLGLVLLAFAILILNSRLNILARWRVNSR